MSVAFELDDPFDSTEPCPGEGQAQPLELGELHRAYQRRLVRLCVRYVVDRALAEDIAQETLLRAVRSLPSFDLERPMWPWLKVIAQRLCLDAIRRRSRERSLVLISDHPSPTNGPDQVIERLALTAALAALSPRQREALHLRYVQGCDRETAASLLGMSNNAFDQLLSRARGRLAAKLEGQRAGALVLVLLAPVRWLRARSQAVRQAAGTAVGVAVTNLPLVAASVVVAVAGTTLINPGHAERTSAPPASAAYTTPLLSAAPRSAPVPRQRAASHASASGVGVNATAGAASASVGVADKPLAPGRTEHHHLSVSTPIGTVVVGGSVDRYPGSGIVCSQRIITCDR